MIVYPYECLDCGKETEGYFKPNKKPPIIKCEECGGDAKSILKPRLTLPLDAAWIKEVLEVVDKKSNKPHCKEFLRHPTRPNWNRWMKGEKLRPMDGAEKTEPVVNEKLRDIEMTKAMGKAWKDTNAVSVK